MKKAVFLAMVLTISGGQAVMSATVGAPFGVSQATEATSSNPAQTRGARLVHPGERQIECLTFCTPVVQQVEPTEDLAEVPAPTTAILLLSALGLLVARRRSD